MNILNLLGMYSLKKLMVLSTVTMEIVHLNVGDGTYKGQCFVQTLNFFKIPFY